MTLITRLPLWFKIFISIALLFVLMAFTNIAFNHAQLKSLSETLRNDQTISAIKRNIFDYSITHVQYENRLHVFIEKKGDRAFLAREMAAAIADLKLRINTMNDNIAVMHHARQGMHGGKSTVIKDMFVNVRKFQADTDAKIENLKELHQKILSETDDNEIKKLLLEFHDRMILNEEEIALIYKVLSDIALDQIRQSQVFISHVDIYQKISTAVVLALLILLLEHGYRVSKRIDMINVEREESKRSLEYSNQFLNAIIESIPDPIFVKNARKEMIVVNTAYADMFNLPRELLMHSTGESLYPPEQLKIFHARDEAVLRGEGITGVLDEIDVLGSHHIIETRKRLFVDDRNQKYIVGVIRDLTETKDAESKLRESQRRFELAQNAARFGVWDWDLRTNDLVWDEAMYRIYNMDPFIFQGHVKDWESKVIPDDLAMMYDLVRAHINDQEKHYFSSSFRIRDDDNRIRFIKVNGNIIRDENDEAYRIVGLNYDITDQKLMEQALIDHREHLEKLVQEKTADLQHEKERAESASRAKSEFLSNMTHELRTPLNSIIGMTKLIKERSHDAETHDMVHVVSDASRMLLAIVNDILDLSKIEANELTLESIGFDLMHVISTTINSVSALAKAKGIELKIEAAQHMVFPILRGDPLRLAQIINNLVSNAIKYTAQGGVVISVLQAHFNDKILVTCRVKDTGMGIPADRLDDVFKKFTQVDSSTTRRFGGTGLGLAITQQLVEKMGGSIGVESVLGQGSVFWFQIPFAKADAVHEELPDAQALKRVRTQKASIPVAQARILVAEDHPLNQMLLKKLLPRFGFRHVTYVENGFQVLEVLKKEPFDLILMDCFMPEIDGYNATRTIRDLESGSAQHIPVIAMTANAMVGEDKKCFDAGMDDYLSKPLSEAEMLEALGQWIAFTHADDTAAENPDTLMIHEARVHQNADIASASEISAIIDLNVMRSFSLGDKAIENEFIAIFIQQSDENIAVLRQYVVDGECPQWTGAAHMMKGGSGSLGMGILQKLCAEAQKMELPTAAQRRDLLLRIEEAYRQAYQTLAAQGYEVPPSSL